MGFLKKSMNTLMLLLSCLMLAAEQIVPLAAAANAKYLVVATMPLSKAATAGGVTSAARSMPVLDNVLETRQTKNCLNINRGNVLLSPDRDICVSTHEANIHIAAGATIFLMESNNSVVIYDLYQNKPKQVAIVVDKAKFFMEPGRMLVLTKQNTQNFETLEANCHSISYHKPHQIDINNEAMRAFVADFSILSAFAKIQPLKRLITSDDKKDKEILGRILKSALLLSNFTCAATP